MVETVMTEGWRWGAVGRGVLVALLLLVVPGGAAAAAPAETRDAAPAELCGPDNIYLRTTQWQGQTIVRELEIATRGGCASSWATGQMSPSAVVGQCKRLEEGFWTERGWVQISYPLSFYGIWEANSRADCRKILHGLATGQLDADVLPFPF